MRIVVDKLPACPRDCLFSKRVRLRKHGELQIMYVCSLREYIEDADTMGDGYKPGCVCKDVTKCSKLALEVL